MFGVAAASIEIQTIGNRMLKLYSYLVPECWCAHGRMRSPSGEGEEGYSDDYEDDASDVTGSSFEEEQV